ncbi:MAG: glycosyltransferase, partial [Daejeonella sp.]
IFNRLSLMIGDYLGVGTLDKVRRRNLNASDGVYVLNSTEKRELSSIFKVDSDRIHVIHLAIPEEHFKLYDSIDAGLFYDTYQIKDFVFYPSAKVSKRKRQVQLLKALQNSAHSIVLTGCDEIEGSIEAEFNELVKNNHNVLALPKVSKELLISCYKNARVCVSLSSAETAGIANLEAAYAGCNLVVSDIPPFREYLRQFATYINPLSLRDIQDQITLAMAVKHDPNVIDFIRSNFTWNAYGRKFLKSLD